MPAETLTSQSYVICSVSRALWGLVTPNLRSVAVGWTDTDICLYAYFDGPISEENVADMAEAGAYVAADFADFQVNEDCIRLDAPDRIALHRPKEECVLVYARKEPR